MNQNEFILELKKINILITDEQLNQLEQYYDLLIEWNQKINLTTIVIKEEVYLKHFYDSLTITKVVDLNKVETLCDIGTGAGFPGIVLKILFPHIKMVLIDSLNKRINFLNEVIKKLNLTGIEAVHIRAEEYSKKNREKFDIVTSRAVAKLNVLLEYAIPMLKVKGYFISYKGNITQEINETEKALKILNCKIVKIEQFILPKENSNRILIKIIKEKRNELKYPRETKEILNKPL